MSKNQSPYMLEVAFDYLRASKLLWGQPNLSGVAIVNAAIAIEIILKSFLAKPEENARKGTISEQYLIAGKKLHTLTELANEIDRDLYKKLKFHEHEVSFEKYNNLFVEARYPYEPGSRGGYTQIPIDIAVKMFRSTIQWYKETGNNDPWVIAYPEVAGGGL